MKDKMNRVKIYKSICISILFLTGFQCIIWTKAVMGRVIVNRNQRELLLLGMQYEVYNEEHPGAVN